MNEKKKIQTRAQRHQLDLDRYNAIQAKVGKGLHFFMIGAFFSVSLAVAGLFTDGLLITYVAVTISMACILGTLILSRLAKYYFKKVDVLLDAMIEELTGELKEVVGNIKAHQKKKDFKL